MTIHNIDRSKMNTL